MPAAQAAALENKPPVRTDYASGLAGQLQYNKARDAYLAKTGGKSTAPKPPDTTTSGIIRGSEVVRSDKPGRYENRATAKSTTPQADEAAKITRIKTLTDDQVLDKAKQGYIDYSVEARRRKLPGYEKEE
jgi:hypothetical protein